MSSGTHMHKCMHAIQNTHACMPFRTHTCMNACMPLRTHTHMHFERSAPPGASYPFQLLGCTLHLSGPFLSYAHRSTACLPASLTHTWTECVPPTRPTHLAHHRRLLHLCRLHLEKLHLLALTLCAPGSLTPIAHTARRDPAAWSHTCSRLGAAAANGQLPLGACMMSE
jgi:hypothetical protein